MAEEKESFDDGSSGSEEGVPGRERTESESVRTESGAEMRNMVHDTNGDQSSKVILFYC